MSTLLTRYTFLQETEWAGRTVYRVRDDSAGRELYLIREQTQASTIACDHPVLPALQPLTAEGDHRWFTAEGVQGESLERLREGLLLRREEIRTLFEAVLSALALLSALNPPLVPGTLEPECIKRTENGQWKLDIIALAFTPDARLSPGIPAGVNSFGRLLYWLVTGESIRHGMSQVPLQQGVSPMLYFMVMRCLGHAYGALGDMRTDLDRLWEDPGFLAHIQELGRATEGGRVRATEAGPLGAPAPGPVEALVTPPVEEPARLVPYRSQPSSLPGPMVTLPQPTLQPDAPMPDQTTWESEPAPTAMPTRAWGEETPPVRVRRTVEPDSSGAAGAPKRSARTLPLRSIALGAALLLVVGISAIVFWPRSTPSLAPESSRLTTPTSPTVAPKPDVAPVTQPPQQPKTTAPELAVDPAEAALLLEERTYRAPDQPKPDVPKPVAPARPAILRPATAPPAFPALQPGSHQSLDMAAGGSPTWLSLDGRWIGYAYIYYSNGRQFISMDAFNAVFGRSLTWAENGINSYAIFENGARLITSDGTRISPTRLWIKLTPEMQQWLGLKVELLDDWGLHFRSLR